LFYHNSAANILIYHNSAAKFLFSHKKVACIKNWVKAVMALPLLPANKIEAKVGVLRDSHNLFSTPYRIFECFFGAKKKKKLC
jgi:hypothetical protein